MKKFVEILLNIILWLIISYFIYAFYADWWEEHKVPFPVTDFFSILLFKFLLPLMVNYYIVYFLLFPKFLMRKKIAEFLFLLILSSVSTGLILNLNGIVSVYKHNISIFVMFMTVLILPMIGGILGTLTKGSVSWYNSIAESKAMEKKHLESQTALLMLKARLNPHFLFNSLNNIDILIEESPKIASEYLRKLSGILRYILYETREDETELIKEINHIKSYVELQRIRSNNPHYVNFSLKGELNEQKIAPMVFLPFIENAFKHSKNKNIDNAVNIEFELHNRHVKMVCKNYYEETRKEVIQNEGIGIETIKQRLNLLYKSKHELAIEKTDHWFIVTLNIDL